jgi:outer membrane receptor protein involved in Fe transport
VKISLPAFRALLVVLFIGCLALAQIGGGSIVGIVHDPTGAAVPGVQVIAHNQETNEERTVSTNEEGYYEFPLLPAGRYRVRAEARGFKRIEGEPFPLSTGTRPRIDLTLTVGDLNEKIEVTATAPQVNTTTTDLGVVMNRARVDELPLNGRNFQELVNLQAGVNVGPSSSAGGRGGISFHGSTSLGTNLLLDGVDMSFGEVNGAASMQSAGGGGTLLNTISVEAIQEFKSTASASSAEYGRAGSGVLNITTRSGSNEWHGGLFEFFRNDKLNASDFFNNKNRLPKPTLRFNQFGGNLAGPMRRDRLFFFFNYEGAEVRRQSLVSGNVPTTALLNQLTPALKATLNLMMPSTYAATSNPLIGFHTRNDNASNAEHTFLTRVDWLISNRQRLAVRDSYNHQTYNTPSLEPTMPTVYPLHFHNAVVEHTFNVGAATLNELRIGLNRVDLFRQPQGWEQIPGYITVQGINSSFGNFIHFVPTTYSLSDNFTMVRGRHSIKIGLDEREVRSVRYQGGPPIYAFTTTADIINQNPASVQLSFTTSKGLRTVNMGYYVQDDWRLSPRLQINLGLRYEYSPPLRGGFNVASSDPYGAYNAPQAPMFAPDHNDFGPRLGIVWTPDAEQRTVLRAGGAMTYVMPQAIYYYDMAYISAKLSGVSTFSAADVPPAYLVYPNAIAFQSVLENNPDLLPSDIKLSRSVADYNRRDTYVGMWNVSLQRQATRTLAVQASYVGQRTVKLISVRPLNLVDPATGQRPIPSLGQVNFEENAANISYNAFELAANQRLWHGLNYDAYFTLAYARGYYTPDDTITFTGSGLQDPLHIAGSNGPFEGQLRRVFRNVVSYAIPGGAHLQNRFLRGVLGGWTLRTIVSWRSGIPINVTTGNDYVGNGRSAGQRPDAVAGVDPYVRNHDSQVWLNPAAFDNTVVKNQKRFGNLGFYALTGPSAFNIDTGLHKTFKLHEQHQLTFRLESFNTLNHTQLSNPGTALNSPQFGIITGAGSQRLSQVAMKYGF